MFVMSVCAHVLFIRQCTGVLSRISAPVTCLCLQQQAQTLSHSIGLHVCDVFMRTFAWSEGIADECVQEQMPWRCFCTCSKPRCSVTALVSMSVMLALKDRTSTETSCEKQATAVTGLA